MPIGLLCIIVSLGFLLGRLKWAVLYREMGIRRTLLPRKLMQTFGEGWFDFFVCSFRRSLIWF